MDLNSENNLEMAEVLLSALNPAARATLWLKVVKSQKEISLPSLQKTKHKPVCIFWLVEDKGHLGANFCSKIF